MILEISCDQLAALLSERTIDAAGMTVRVVDGASRLLREANEPTVSRVTDEPDPLLEPSTARLEAKAALTGKEQFWMRARFESKCPHAFCSTGRIERGERVLRDVEHGKTYCAPCGRDLYPNVIDERAVTA